MFCLGQEMSERNSVSEYFIPPLRSRVWMLLSSQMCYRHPEPGIWFGNSGSVHIFSFSLPPSICLCSHFARLSPASYSNSLDSEAISVRRPTFSAFEIIDIASDLRSGFSRERCLRCACLRPPPLTPIHLCVCPFSPPLHLPVSPLFSYSERFFVKLNKSGLPKSPEKTERQCTLFVVSCEQSLCIYDD